MKNTISIFTIFILFQVFIGCNKPKDEAIPELEIDSYELIFQTDEDHKIILLYNPTNEKLTFDISTSNNYLIIPNPYGSIDANDSILIDVHINRAHIDQTKVESQITINSYYGEIQIPTIINHIPESKIKLGTKVDFVAFSQETNILYLRPERFENQEYYFIKYDVVNDTAINVPVSFFYARLFISENGKKLILASWNNLYVLNSETYDVETQLGLSALDIICMQEKMYVFPSTIGNFDHSIYDFSTANITNGWLGDYYNHTSLNAHLHPNREHIYALNTKNYQNNLIRIGVNGINNYFYEELNGIHNKIWLSKDGSKLFSKTNTYYHIITENTGFNLVEKQFVLQVNGEVINVDQSINRQEIYISMDKSNFIEENVVYVYDNNMNFKRIVEGEYYIKSAYNNGQYYEYIKPTIKHVFYSEKSDQLILITYIKNSSSEYAIDVVDL
ncbi:MAG: hypothetical protein GQ527_08665 [Bacteroidales bacterium]|nr:hypothetical protein [Bacteroidales bacterium]